MTVDRDSESKDSFSSRSFSTSFLGQSSSTLKPRHATPRLYIDIEATEHRLDDLNLNMLNEQRERRGSSELSHPALLLSSPFLSPLHLLHL